MAALLSLREKSEHIVSVVGYAMALKSSVLRDELVKEKIDPFDGRRQPLAIKAIDAARTRNVQDEEPEETARRVVIAALTAMGYSKARALFDFARKKPR